MVNSFAMRNAPTKDEALDLASNVALVGVLHNGKTVSLLVRRSSKRKKDLPKDRKTILLNDELTRISVPMILRSLDLQRCHADISCHFGASRTIHSLE